MNSPKFDGNLKQTWELSVLQISKARRTEGGKIKGRLLPLSEAFRYLDYSLKGKNHFKR